jgi:hypothetical protein
MKWRVRVQTKRRRKQALRVKASTLDELVDKLARHASKIEDIQIETAVSDPAYWRSVILNRLFEKTHGSDANPILF